MSIQDRDYHVENTLRKLGIFEAKERLRRNDAGPFNINIREAKAAKAERSAGWWRLLFRIGVAVVLAVVLLKFALKLLKT